MAARRLIIRICASVLSAACTGLIIGSITGIGMALRGGHGPTYVKLIDLLWFVAMSAFFGGAIGALPAFAVLSLTKARIRPWRSLPTLIIGAVIGFLCLALPLFFWNAAPQALLNTASVLGPTIGAFVASLFVTPTLER